MKTKSQIRLLSLFLVAILLLFNYSCNPNDPNNPTSSATVKGADGNVYYTITIGTQTWMAENLRTTKYKDGTAIPLVTDNTAWGALSTPAYCWYNNDASTYKATYGALYNWYAVGTGKLAPTGWHVPTDAEWTTLENYVSANLGTSGSVGKALAATTDWATSRTNVGGIGNDLLKNNSSGFSARPGGGRDSGGPFFQGGDEGFWWSSTQINTTNALCRFMDYELSFVYKNGGSKAVGLSVRCVRD